MRKFLTFVFLLHFLFIQSQTSPVYLGSQITNGVTTGGCESACQGNPLNPPTDVCNPTGTGNHTASTMTTTITIPAGQYLSLNINSIGCGSSFGLDSGDDVKVNGVSIAPIGGYSANTTISYSGCFQNPGSSDYSFPVALTANRRDETVTVSWTLSNTDPGGSCSILPISLTTFSTTKINNQVILFWSTASETNNDYFTIERSGDGVAYEAIGQIKGAGNSSKEISYEFTDEKPVTGLNYYRIKQTDFDGKYSYSEVRSVRFTDGASVTVSPRTTEGRVDITTDIEDYNVEVYTAAGAQVKAFTGMNADQSISIEDLKAGIYFLRVSSTTASETVRVIKL